MVLVRLIGVADDDITSDSSLIRKAVVKENTFAPITRILHIGDGPYSGEGKTWAEKTKAEYGPELIKLFRIVRGNHDCKNSEKAQTQVDIGEAFNLPTTGNWLWAEQVENVYLIGMDSEDLDIEFERDQKKFVTDEIAKAKQLRVEGKIDWILVMVHKPWFTLKSTASPYTAVRKIYNDMFLDAQVDFMFYGHNHNWQGWYPMEVDFTEEANGLGKQLFEYAEDGKIFDFSKRHGWQGTVTGSAGHEWNGINDQGDGVKNVMKYFDSGLFVYSLLEIDGKKAKLFAKDTDNKVVFEASFTREGGIIPPPIDCPPGQHPENGICVPDVIIPPPGGNPEPTCPPGYTFNKATCNCVKNDPEPQLCKTNWYFNEELGRCIPKLIPDDPTAPLGVDARFPTSQMKAKAGTVVILDGSTSTGVITSWEIVQSATDVAKVTLTDIPAPGRAYSKQFTMPDTTEVLDFTLTVRNAQSSDVANVMVQREDVIIPPPPVGEVDAFGMKILAGKPTGKNVAMEKGTDHENGQRYNVNHEFHNYIMQGYYKLGQGQDAINHKGDGPNHGSCKDADICIWYELHLELSDGKCMLQFEQPHPDNHDVPDSSLESVKAVGKLNAGDWIGWATAYYWGPDGKRHMKAFVDKTPFDAAGKPTNTWEEVLFAIEKGQIVSGLSLPRNMQAVIDHEAGLESEIRMNNGTNGDTEMKNAWVIELEPQGVPA